MHAAEKTETFHMQNLCLPACPSVLPRCCHRHADNPTTPACMFNYSHALLLWSSACPCLSRSTARLPCWAATLDQKRRRAKKGLHEAFRQPCRRSALVRAADTHHHSTLAQRELRPRYKSLAKGTCEFRSDSLGSIIVITFKLFVGALKIGRSSCVLLRGCVLSSFPKADACLCCIFPCSMPLLLGLFLHARGGCRDPPTAVVWLGLIDSRSPPLN